MSFGKNDREYAPPTALPDWLKEFADKTLKQAESPFEAIKNVFKENELDSVEAKVEEIRQRVGLDKLEKSAKAKVKDEILGGLGDNQPKERFDKEQFEKGIKIELEHTNDPEVAEEIVKDHLQETKDFKDGKGAKYYDKLDKMEEEFKDELAKKSDLINNLVKVANFYDSIGDYEKMEAVDDRIRKLADSIQLEKLERLPIMPVEMWTDFQLNQAVNQPDLFEKEKDKFEKVKQEIAKRLGKRGLKPAEIGNWREHGWWAVYFAGLLIGFTNNDSNAQLIKLQMVNRFAEQGINGLEGVIKDEIQNDVSSRMVGELADNLIGHYSYEDIQDMSGSDIRETVNKILNSPNYKGDRKKFIENSLSIFKMPQEFELEGNSRAVIKGGIPTNENYIGSRDEIDNIYESSDIDESYEGLRKTFENQGNESFRKGFEAEGEFVQRHVEEEKRKLEGHYPEEEAEDGFKLSCRDKSFFLSKRAEEIEAPEALLKHKGIKKHIDNICKSRDGHIEAPALMHIILSRPDSKKLNDNEKNDIRDYIKRKIKESKKDMNFDNDDNIIGLNELSSVDVNNEDENSEVFSKPAKM